jgi:hypothetical protein
MHRGYANPEFPWFATARLRSLEARRLVRSSYVTVGCGTSNDNNIIANRYAYNKFKQASGATSDAGTHIVDAGSR